MVLVLVTCKEYSISVLLSCQFVTKPITKCHIEAVGIKLPYTLTLTTVLVPLQTVADTLHPIPKTTLVAYTTRACPYVCHTTMEAAIQNRLT